MVLGGSCNVLLESNVEMNYGVPNITATGSVSDISHRSDHNANDALSLYLSHTHFPSPTLRKYRKKEDETTGRDAIDSWEGKVHVCKNHMCMCFNCF